MPLFSVRRLPWVRRFAAAGLAIAFCAAPADAADQGGSGEQIYRRQCAACHGASGEGTQDSYPQPLVGKHSLEQLADYIARSMPEDAPGTCVGDDARKVAAFVYDAFYSPVAQERNRPARIELSRLTVRQYENALADLLGSFRAPAVRDERRGLHGQYFKSKHFGGGRIVDRTDPAIQFDFGAAGAQPGKIDADGFSIRWQGSVLALESGDYEFIVKTPNAARLWINRSDRPLIDAWVRSGGESERRESIRLLGGRRYALRLDFMKSQEKTASVVLEWKPPHRAAEVIPSRHLSPGSVPEVFVLQTPFPPDDRSVGYERGTSISQAWEQATTEAAVEAAAYVAGRLQELSGVGDAPDRGVRTRAFCREFVERALRRPLTGEQERVYVVRRFEGAADPETAVKRVVLMALKSPRFLYRETGGRPDAYDAASRLSFAIWDSLPDGPLLEAARAGRLATRAQVVSQAERMVGAPAARAKLRDFFFDWLKVREVPDISKDPAKYPAFEPAVASDLRTSLDLFLGDVISSDASDFRQVLLADSVYLNGRLARFYGADLPRDAPFQKVSLDAGRRAGVLTHPYLMATFAYTGSTSPIHRGVFLARNVLGRSLRPPPVAVAPLAADLHPGLTTRQRVALQTRPETCQSCHAMINPLGFALEHFDAVGRMRSEDMGRPVDASGSYLDRRGQLAKFAGARDLAVFLAGSDEVHEAFVEYLFHNMVRQPIRAYGAHALADLTRTFAEHEFSVGRLAVAIAALAAMPPQSAAGQ